MGRIVEVHHPGLNDALLKQALDAFYAIRNMERLRKTPSTSELVDWIAMLQDMAHHRRRGARRAARPSSARC